MYEILKARKEELGYTYEEIAEKANLALELIVDYFEGRNLSLEYESLRKIERVLFEERKIDKICEPQPAYNYGFKRQGEYTVEDYLAWPEEQRIELIDGVIYDMASPTDIHQVILLQLASRFDNFVRNKRGRCITFSSPMDVQLDKDNKTMVQPDVLILCDKSKLKNGKIYGAPDFVVEVLSPSTHKKDMIKKLSKYQAAGVKEYWIVDPMEKKVIVYSNMTPETKDITIYPFESKIPVGIYDGECIVDFAEIWEYVCYWCAGEVEQNMNKDYEQREDKAKYTYKEKEDMVNKICEPQPAYNYGFKRQGEYTVEDYLAWPEEQRIELIDGVIYDMASPTDIHQLLVTLLAAKLVNYIGKQKGQCIPFVSPIDVQLDMDNRTMVQPDILILCDKNKRKNGKIYGAPDFIVEVLSPSTRKKDMFKKLSKYQAAGVREYWIVDPMEKKVIVYSNMTPETKDIAIYPFESKIPVGIYGGDCIVDFTEIDEYLKF